MKTSPSPSLPPNLVSLAQSLGGSVFLENKLPVPCRRSRGWDTQVHLPLINTSTQALAFSASTALGAPVLEAGPGSVGHRSLHLFSVCLPWPQNSDFPLSANSLPSHYIHIVQLRFTYVPQNVRNV